MVYFISPNKLVRYWLKHFFILFLFFGQLCQAQSLEGKITDSLGSVEMANVFLKTLPDSTMVNWTTTDENGAYKLKFKTSKTHFLLEVQSFSHQKFSKEIEIRDSDGQNKFDVFLFPRSEQLREVILKPKERKYRVRNDTLFFKADAYKDGTERSIEDLLKKLPGIQVKEDGEVLYKGKEIKALLLDGDDLFGRDYKKGTRNLNPDIIEEIQAIDHFDDNPLLRDLRDSQDVAINLKIKEGKTVISGSLSLGYAPKDKQEHSGYLGMFSKKVKTFGSSSYNNIGKNRSPYDFRSTAQSLGGDRGSLSISAPEILRNGSFYSPFGDEYHLLNNNFYSGLNGFFHFNESTKLRLGIDFANDRLIRRNRNETVYNFDAQDSDQSFNTLRLENLQQKPRLYNGSYKLEGKIKDNLLWDYVGKWTYKEESMANKLNNNGFLQNADGNSYNFLTRQEVHATKRLNERSALETRLLYTYNRLPQKVDYAPFLPLEEFQISRQNLKLKKQVTALDFDYYLRLEEWVLQAYLGGSDIQNTLHSSMINFSPNQEIEDNKNNIVFNQISVSGNIKLNREWQRLKLEAAIHVEDFDLRWKDSLDKKSTNLIAFLPKLMLTYRVKGSSFFGLAEIQNTGPEIQNLYQNPILIDYHTLSSSEADLKLQQRSYFSVGYNYDDAFTLTHIRTNAFTSIQKRNFLSESQITPNFTTTHRFLADFSTRHYGANAEVEQFLGFIKARGTLSLGYDYSTNKNIINELGLRNTKIQTFRLENEITKKLAENLYLQNDFKLNYSLFSAENRASNSFAYLSNKLALSYKIDRLTAKFNTQYNRPSLSEKQDYWFMNLMLDYRMNQNLSFSLNFHNLANYKTYRAVSVSDFSRSTESYDLIPRYIMGGVYLHF